MELRKLTFQIRNAFKCVLVALHFNLTGNLKFTQTQRIETCLRYIYSVYFLFHQYFSQINSDFHNEKPTSLADALQMFREFPDKLETSDPVPVEVVMVPISQESIVHQQFYDQLKLHTWYIFCLFIMQLCGNQRPVHKVSTNYFMRMSDIIVTLQSFVRRMEKVNKQFFSEAVKNKYISSQ